MKNFSFLIALLFAGSILLSCGDDDSISISNELKASVDGNSFTAITTGFSKSQGLLAISGTSGTESITFALTADAVGTYQLGIGGANGGAYFPDNSGSASFSSTSGTIVITEISDTKIVATFEFEARNFDNNDNVVISNGSLNISN